MSGISWRAVARALRGCPPEWRLSQAVSEGVGASLGQHLNGCTRCANLCAQLREVAQWAPTLSPVEEMNDDSRERIAGMLVRGGAERAPERRAVVRFRSPSLAVAAVGAAAVTAVVGITIGRGWLRSGQSDPGAWSDSDSSKMPGEGSIAPSHASIRVIGQARFTRKQSPPDELVRLEEGTIELQVTPLGKGDRFRVATGDAEVEVKGTHFKVTASRHNLVAVHVWRGRVEVKSYRGAFTTLQAGDDWVAAPEATGGGDPAGGGSGDEIAAPVPADDPGPGAAARPRSDGGSTTPRFSPERPYAQGGDPSGAHPAAANRSDTPEPNGPARVLANRDRADPGRPRRPERPSFDHAWSLLRRGDNEAAAAAFAEVQQQAAGSAIEEDALYWQAIAVGRTSSNTTEAGRLLREFLRRYPTSSRVGPANVALGWWLLKGGDFHAASQAFARAADDPSPRVRASAREGLSRSEPKVPAAAPRP